MPSSRMQGRPDSNALHACMFFQPAGPSCPRASPVSLHTRLRSRAAPTLVLTLAGRAVIVLVPVLRMAVLVAVLVPMAMLVAVLMPVAVAVAVAMLVLARRAVVVAMALALVVVVVCRHCIMEDG